MVALRSALVLSLVLQVEIVPPRLKHIQMGADDRFLLCASSVLGKPVLRDAWRPWPDDSAPCPASLAQLRDGLARIEQRLLEFDQVFLTVPERRFTDEAKKENFTIRFTTLTVEDHIRAWAEDMGTALTPAEVLAIGRDMLVRARPLPVLIPLPYMVKPDGSATIHRTVRVLQRALAASGPPTIIGVLGTDERMFGGVGRIVVGRKTETGFQLLWDSPLLDTYSLGIGFIDFDRDGVDEIVLQSDLSGAIGFNVFSVTGEELTRQEWCTVRNPFVSSYPPASGTCPIVAAEIEIDDSVKGPKQLLVTGRWEDPPAMGSRRYRYRLVNGRYRSPEQAK